MKLIAHRCNTIAALQATAPHYGIEVDIRSYGQELISNHDPFGGGESLIAWLEAYKHSTLILNVKEEGLEARLIALMAAHHINDYFFLDQSFPALVKLAQAGEQRCAVRVSEFESIATALSLAGKVAWVWVDYFNKLPLSSAAAQLLKNKGFKLCLVSPELQGHDAGTAIPELAALLRARHIEADAVCTKHPERWEAVMS